MRDDLMKTFKIADIFQYFSLNWKFTFKTDFKN